MAKVVSLSVIKKQIENSTKAEAIKIVDKYINEITPKIKEELTEIVIRNLFSIVESETDEHKPEINITFQDITFQDPETEYDFRKNTPKKGAK